MIKNDVRTMLMNFKNEGIIETLRRFFFRFLKVHIFYVYNCNLKQEIEVKALDSDMMLQEVSFQQLKALRSPETNYPSEFLRDGIDNESRCFVTLVLQKLAFIAWVSSSPSSGFIKLNSKQVEANYIYTLNEFRGKALMAISLSQIASILKYEGLSDLFIAVHFENIASIKALHKCGFIQIGSAKRWGPFAWAPSKMVYDINKWPELKFNQN